MITIRSNDIHHLWLGLAKMLVTTNRVSSPRGMRINEELNVHLELHDPLSNVLWHPERKLNYRFMVAEWLWIYFGHDDVKTIARYNPRIAQFSDNGVDFNGSYGVPVKAQWPRLVELLRNDPDTRQAVLVIFRPQTGPTKDVPCTISLQFLLRPDGLHTIATMRSSDIWWGLPHDVFNFTMLANCLATEIGYPPLKSFSLNIGSSHLYERDFQSVAHLIDTADTFETFRSPRFTVRPPAYLDTTLMDPHWPDEATDVWHWYQRVLSWTDSKQFTKPSVLMRRLCEEVE